MSTPKDWRPVVDGDDWMRGQEKRMAHEERRPRLTSPRDLLGPGFAPYAVRLLDWNSPAARFNGMWVSEEALNQPGPGTWLGLSVGTVDGHVMQMAVSHPHGIADPHEVWMRRMHTHAAQAPTYSPWERVVPPADVTPVGTVNYLPLIVPVPTGWLAANGQSVDTATYPDLAAALGMGGVTFTVPDVTSPDAEVRAIIKT
jgi:hypothetical protein